MSKKYDSESSLRGKLMQGINVLADNVASTLGPKGRNVIIHEEGKRPVITKDGVTVAKFVHLEDEFANVGAQIVKQASAKTNADAGDGTTTSTVLARAIFAAATDHVVDHTTAIEVKRGIDKAVAAANDCLLEMARPIQSESDIAHIATISANGDVDIGNLVALAVDRVGKDGSITIEEARSVDTSLDLMEGFRFDSGYAASAFITDQRKGVARYEEPLFLVTDEKLETVDQILPSLEIAARENRPFVIVADDIEGQALAALIMNSMRGTMKVAAVKAPRYGEERRGIMSDLAHSLGAKYFRKSAGHNLKDVKLTDFGSAKTVDIAKGVTTIVGGRGDFDEVEKRIEGLKSEIGQTESLHEAERLQERITRLASGVAVIRVGAATEIEMIEKKHRIEDALEAVRAAQMEGVVPGGGSALLSVSRDLGSRVEASNDAQGVGVSIICAALESPVRQMAINCGLDEDEIVQRMNDVDPGCGLNFATGEIVDLFEVGIIDPVKVTRCALRNAASVAGTLLTTNYAIIESNKQKED
jgi:chaperonin GroEL